MFGLNRYGSTVHVVRYIGLIVQGRTVHMDRSIKTDKIKNTMGLKRRKLSLFRK